MRVCGPLRGASPRCCSPARQTRRGCETEEEEEGRRTPSAPEAVRGAPLHRRRRSPPTPTHLRSFNFPPSSAHDAQWGRTDRRKSFLRRSSVDVDFGPRYVVIAESTRCNSPNSSISIHLTLDKCRLFLRELITVLRPISLCQSQPN